MTESNEDQSFTIEEVFGKHSPGQTEAAVYLRGIRYREDLTQKQLADLAGIPQRHLSEMENGKRPIGKENAKKLAKVLNADLVKQVSKSPIFLDTFYNGLSPTSTTSHLPDGSRAPREDNLRQSCSWAARRFGCCIGSSRTITSVLLDFTQPWQFVMA